MRLAMRLLSALALPFVFACSGGSPAAVDTTADEAAIRAIDSNWNGWLTAQNDSAIGAIYASDAVMLPPNMPRAEGSAAIRAFWAGLWPTKANLVLTPGTIRVSGNLAIEEGTWTISVPSATGADKDNGKYLVAWRKDGGTWHAVQDMWNSDNLAPIPTPAVK